MVAPRPKIVAAIPTHNEQHFIGEVVSRASRYVDGVVLQEPTYYPFFPTVKQNGCQIVTNKLKLSGGHY